MAIKVHKYIYIYSYENKSKGQLYHIQAFLETSYRVLNIKSLDFAVTLYNRM